MHTLRQCFPEYDGTINIVYLTTLTRYYCTAFGLLFSFVARFFFFDDCFRVVQLPSDPFTVFAVFTSALTKDLQCWPMHQVERQSGFADGAKQILGLQHHSVAIFFAIHNF